MLRPALSSARESDSRRSSLCSLLAGLTALAMLRAGLGPEGVRGHVATSAVSAAQPTLGGFDMSQANLDPREIRSGGPPKDGIPALTNPRAIAVGEADFLRPTDRVVGLVIGNQARAYPISILNYHEIVNDKLGGAPVAVTYCPLCDSAAAFDRRTDFGVREFGVSGLLYNSNVLMYDRGGTIESLWSQVLARGVSGPGVGKSLAALPLEVTTWKAWAERHPATTVVSLETGHQRDYRANPYRDYFRGNALMFPAEPASDRLGAKERVLGVWHGTTARAYPLSAFGRNQRRLTDTVDGKQLTVVYDPEAKSLRVEKADDGLQWMYSFWFAWYAMRPETTVFTAR